MVKMMERGKLKSTKIEVILRGRECCIMNWQQPTMFFINYQIWLLQNKPFSKFNLLNWQKNQYRLNMKKQLTFAASIVCFFCAKIVDENQYMIMSRAAPDHMIDILRVNIVKAVRIMIELAKNIAFVRIILVLFVIYGRYSIVRLIDYYQLHSTENLYKKFQQQFMLLKENQERLDRLI